MQRRFVLSVLGSLCAGGAWGQRVTNPIARPPRQRAAAAAIAAGRFNQANAAAGPLPGLFTIVSIDAAANTLQLKDEEGRTGTVHAKPEMIDVEEFKAGDVVEVDFMVPVPGSPAFEAAGIWPVQR